MQGTVGPLSAAQVTITGLMSTAVKNNSGRRTLVRAGISGAWRVIVGRCVSTVNARVRVIVLPAASAATTSKVCAPFESGPPGVKLVVHGVNAVPVIRQLT